VTGAPDQGKKRITGPVAQPNCGLQARLEQQRKLKEIAEAAQQGKLHPAADTEAAEAAERAKKRCRALLGVRLPSSSIAGPACGTDAHPAICPPRRVFQASCEGPHPGIPCLFPPRLCRVAA